MFHYSFIFSVSASSELYTLSLHDALPISGFTATTSREARYVRDAAFAVGTLDWTLPTGLSQLRFGLETASEDYHDTDRKSTRLNSSHLVISYAVFCLKNRTIVTNINV